MIYIRAILSFFLTGITLCHGGGGGGGGGDSQRIEFSRAVETLRDHLVSDLGLSTFPNVRKVNKSFNYV